MFCLLIKMLSTVFKNYNYQQVVAKCEAPAMIIGATVGVFYGAYTAIHPRLGAPRFGDALLGGIVGGGTGYVTGFLGVWFHPALVFMIPAAIPYLYNSYQQHKMDRAILTVRR